MRLLLLLPLLLLVAGPSLIVAHVDTVPSNDNSDDHNHNNNECDYPLLTSRLSLLNNEAINHFNQSIPVSQAVSSLSSSSTRFSSSESGFESARQCLAPFGSSRTCCSSATLNDFQLIRTILEDFRDNLAVDGPNFVINTLFFSSGARLSINQSASNANILPQLNQRQLAILTEFAAELSRVLSSAAGPCTDGIINYIQGLLCLGCDPVAFQQFYDVSTHQLLLHWPVCESTWFLCQPLLESITAALPRFMDLTIAFLIESRESLSPLPLPETTSASLVTLMFARSLMNEAESGVSSERFCLSGLVESLEMAGEKSYGDCWGAFCSMALRGLDYNVSEWLGAATQPIYSAPNTIISHKKKNNNHLNAVSPVSPLVSPSLPLPVQRRLLQLNINGNDHNDNTDYTTTTNNSPQLGARFHLLHGGHGGPRSADMDMDGESPPSSSLSFALIFSLKNQERAALMQREPHHNGYIRSIFSDGEDSKPVFDAFLLGCSTGPAFSQTPCPNDRMASKAPTKRLVITSFTLVISALTIIALALLATYILTRPARHGLKQTNITDRDRLTQLLQSQQRKGQRQGQAQGQGHGHGPGHGLGEEAESVALDEHGTATPELMRV